METKLSPITIIPVIDSIDSLEEIDLSLLTTSKRSWLRIARMNDEMASLAETCIGDFASELDHRRPIRVAGKDCFQNRSDCFLSNDTSGYHFASSKAKAIPMTEGVSILMQYVNQLPTKIGQTPCSYNGCLVNYYENGSEYLASDFNKSRNFSQRERWEEWDMPFRRLQGN